MQILKGFQAIRRVSIVCDKFQKCKSFLYFLILPAIVYEAGSV